MGQEYTFSPRYDNDERINQSVYPIHPEIRILDAIDYIQQLPERRRTYESEYLDGLSHQEFEEAYAEFALKQPRKVADPISAKLHSIQHYDDFLDMDHTALGLNAHNDNGRAHPHGPHKTKKKVR